MAGNSPVIRYYLRHQRKGKEMWQGIETVPFGIDVLVFQPEPPVITIGMASPDDRMGFVYTQSAARIRVTHWMPLPEPPK